MNWYFDAQGVASGPMDEEALRVEVSAGRIQASTLVWRTGMERWLSVEALRPEWWVKPSPESASVQASLAAARASTAQVPVAAPQEGGFLKKIFGFGKKRA